MQKKLQAVLSVILTLAMITGIFTTAAANDMSKYAVVEYDPVTGVTKTTYDLSLIPEETWTTDDNNNTNTTAMQGISPFNLSMPLNQQLVSNYDVIINFLYNNAYHEKVLKFGQTLTIEAMAKNSSAASKYLTLIVAEYQNNKLLSLQRKMWYVYNNNYYQTTSINLTLPSTNTQGYSVKAFVWDFTTFQPYGESVALTGTSTDYYANNIDNAANIYYNRTVNGKIDSVSDIDWFKINNNDAGSYFIYTTGSTNTKGILYDSDMTTIIYQSDSQPTSSTTRDNNFKIGATLEYDKTYYLKVSSENNSTGDYTLLINKIAEPNCEWFGSQYSLLNKGQWCWTQVGTNSNNWDWVQTKAGNDINVLPVWNYTKGNGVKIGIIDGGINPQNPNFSGRISSNPAGYNFVRGNSTIREELWHGSFVSGIVAANGYTNGFMGVAPESQIVPLIALDSSDRFYDSSVISAISYANSNNIGILNLSLQGTNGYSTSLLNAVNSVNSKILMIICAGNYGVNLTGKSSYWLASLNLSNTIIVANTNGEGLLDYSSNYGGYTHIAAPGTGINSTFDVNSTGWSIGTSFSAPMVSGTAALLKSYYPNLTVDQLKNRIINANNVSKKSSLIGKVSSGGVLNAWLAFANPQPSTPYSLQQAAQPVFDESRRTEILMAMEEAPEESFSNQIIVKFKENSVKDAIVNSISPNAIILNDLSLINSLVLGFEDVQEAKDMVSLYNESDDVYYAEPDYIIDMNN